MYSPITWYKTISVTSNTLKYFPISFMFVGAYRMTLTSVLLNIFLKQNIFRCVTLQ